MKAVYWGALIDSFVGWIYLIRYNNGYFWNINNLFLINIKYFIKLNGIF